MPFDTRNKGSPSVMSWQATSWEAPYHDDDAGVGEAAALEDLVRVVHVRLVPVVAPPVGACGYTMSK
jgi:hypothetical protein